MKIHLGYIRGLLLWSLATVVVSLFVSCSNKETIDSPNQKAELVLAKMTLQEKIGQLSQVNSNAEDGRVAAGLQKAIANGDIGSILNEANPDIIREMQRLAVEESRLGIPLLFGRDVIHGFKTIFPINIGMAATFNPVLIEASASVAAREATSVGINWNFAPMVDVARDPRWGRMAESFGEDPLLVTKMGVAMLKGFQGDDLKKSNTMAACAKHFVGYGAAEGGRDYNTTSIPDVELWNTYFPPFLALTEAGISTFMTGFNELNGVPASGNKYLFRDILKEKWDFHGFVVSDWASIVEMQSHGFVANPKEAAQKAMIAGVDMEMASTSYAENIETLLAEKKISMAMIDEAVKRILTVKFQLNLFDSPYVEKQNIIIDPPQSHLDLAKKIAVQSLVLLKNENNTLPLNPSIGKVAVIGPMANDRYEQLGTWIFDGDTNLSITPLSAIVDMLGYDNVLYAKGLDNTRSRNTQKIANAVAAAQHADVSLVFAGEESIITGEAHSRAFLNLPGAQEELIRAVSETGTQVVLVIMTPRPLAIGEILPYADAVIYAWHPGSMAGPAISDVLFGIESPSGKLPVSFPKTAGQIPIYYAHKNTGRPPSQESFVAMEDIPVRSFQTSLGNTSHYMDVGFKPLFPFGFGLSYSSFSYADLALTSENISLTDTLRVSVKITNSGDFEAEEVAQLYLHDLSASITRPVRELKDFQRVRLMPGETKTLSFNLAPSQLGFYDANGQYTIEPGEFQLWVGGDSEASLSNNFHLYK